MEMHSFVLIWVGLFGLAVGSFLNVVIYRLPRHLNFYNSRSICPKCQNQLRWYHNFPVFSFLFLRGRCGFCGGSISWRYPFVELLNAAVYLYLFRKFGYSPDFLVYIFVVSTLIVIFFIDLDFMIIPDYLTIPGMVIGLGVSLLPNGIGIVNALIGLLVGGAALYLIALLGDFLFKKESMGGGDIKMAAMLGAFLGWQKILLIFISSALIGLIVSIIAMSYSKKLRKDRLIPFGPFLAVAAILAISYGDQIIEFYLVCILAVR